jgi:predicted phosphodiesterase
VIFSGRYDARRMRIGLMSDTHGFLDDAIYKYFAECDEVWHPGDFGPGALGRLQAFNPLRGVYGNIDGSESAAKPRKTFTGTALVSRST